MNTKHSKILEVLQHSTTKARLVTLHDCIVPSSYKMYLVAWYYHNCKQITAKNVSRVLCITKHQGSNINTGSWDNSGFAYPLKRTVVINGLRLTWSIVWWIVTIASIKLGYVRMSEEFYCRRRDTIFSLQFLTRICPPVVGLSCSIIGGIFDNRLSFAHTDDVYSLMENIVTVAIPEIQSTDNNGVSTTFPSLNRFSLYLFTSVMFCFIFYCICYFCHVTHIVICKCMFFSVKPLLVVKNFVSLEPNMSAR